MFSNPSSEPFREPVNQIEYPDYVRYVTTPMDLMSVRESLMTGMYEAPTDFQHEVALIFANSKQYNTNPKSKVLAMTHKLESWFGERISRILHDWKRSKRRLSSGPTSKNEKRPKFKGKGKGTGKGQSNRINKTRLKSEDEDDETESDSDDDSDEEFFGAEGVKKKQLTRLSSRLPSPTRAGKRGEVDFDNPQPCSSRTVLRAATSRNFAEIDHAEESSPEFGQRRSNRPHKIPARYVDDSPPRPVDSSTTPMAPTDVGLECVVENVNNDVDDVDDDAPLISRRVKSKKVTLRDVEMSGTSGKQKPKNANSKYSGGDDNDDESGEEEEEEENSESDSEDEMPLLQRKRKSNGEHLEQQPTPKKTRRQISSDDDDDDDVPLASKKVSQKMTSTMSSQTGRPVRGAAKKVKNFGEMSSEEDEENLRPLRRREAKRRSISADENDHDSSVDDESGVQSRRNRRVPQRIPAQKKRKKQSEESESEFSEDDDEDDEEEGSEEVDLDDDNDEDFIDDSEVTRKSKKTSSKTSRPRMAGTASSR